MKNWYDDLKTESVKKSAEFAEQIELPKPGETPRIVVINGDVKSVETAEFGDMIVANVIQLRPTKEKGEMILPKSMRHHMAASMARQNLDYTKVGLDGKTFKIWAIEDKGQTFYHAALQEQTTLPNGDKK